MHMSGKPPVHKIIHSKTTLKNLVTSYFLHEISVSYPFGPWWDHFYLWTKMAPSWTKMAEIMGIIRSKYGVTKSIFRQLCCDN